MVSCKSPDFLRERDYVSSRLDHCSIETDPDLNGYF